MYLSSFSSELLCLVFLVFHSETSASNFGLYGQPISSAEPFGWPQFELVIFKIGTDDISSCDIRSVEVSSADREVEGSEFKAQLWTELAVISEVQEQFEDVRAVSSVCDNSAPSLRLFSSLAASFSAATKWVFEDIPVHGIQGGSPKAASCNFSCLHMQISIKKSSDTS
jgi:hypothetical protein